MDEVAGTIFDGDTAVVEGTTVLLDGPTDAAGWHAHVSLPLDMLLQPGEEMRLVFADGRSGPVEVSGAQTVEGDRVLHLLTGLGPIVG
jgi:hypothetical protein